MKFASYYSILTCKGDCFDWSLPRWPNPVHPHRIYVFKVEVNCLLSRQSSCLFISLFLLLFFHKFFRFPAIGIKAVSEIIKDAHLNV